MSTVQQTRLRFISVDFPIVNFQSEKLLKEDEVIDVNITPKVFIPKDNKNIFKIIQDVNVSVEGTFKLNLIAVGSFELIDVLEEDLRASFINMNAPAIMFPYVRAFISTLSANLGNVTGTLNIPPQFFRGTLEELKDGELFSNTDVKNAEIANTVKAGKKRKLKEK